MKIAMIGSKGLPAVSGGIERHVEELSAELAQIGHEVLVYTRSWYTGQSAAHMYRGVLCVPTWSINSKHLDAISHTFASIVAAARAHVDVFHIHGVGPALLAWLPKLLRPSAKVVVTFHCIDRHHGKWGFVARWMLRMGEWMAVKAPDATVSVAKSLQDYARLTYNAHTVYVPNGTHIPNEVYAPEPLQAFGLTPGDYLMFCARMVPHKNAHLAIAAWKQLRATRPELVGGKKLALVGGGAFTDAYIKRIHALAQDDESIVLTGAQSGSTLQSLFAHAYAFVHPSSSEGMPIAILEAMSFGKCVIAADISESRELVDGHGLTFIDGNVDDLAAKMAMVLECPDLTAAVGHDGRDFVTRHYDWQDIAQTTSYLYESLLFAPRVREA